MCLANSVAAGALLGSCAALTRSVASRPGWDVMPGRNSTSGARDAARPTPLVLRVGRVLPTTETPQTSGERTAACDRRVEVTRLIRTLRSQPSALDPGRLWDISGIRRGRRVAASNESMTAATASRHRDPPDSAREQPSPATTATRRPDGLTPQLTRIAWKMIQAIDLRS